MTKVTKNSGSDPVMKAFDVVELALVALIGFVIGDTIGFVIPTAWLPHW